MIQVESECPATYDLLERHVLPSLPRTESTGNQIDVRIRIDRANGTFQLLIDDVLVESDSHAFGLIPTLVKLLDVEVVRRLKTLRAVHAGAVLWNDRAILIPGPTHAGKSSMVAELLRRGATYFSDEYALIDSNGYVHPYPRPMLLRNGSPEQFPVLPTECDAPVGKSPAQIGWILSLQYQPATGWKVDPIPQSEAVLILLRNTPHVMAELPDTVRTFQCAAARTVCYAGSRPDVVEAATEILQLIHRIPAVKGREFSSYCLPNRPLSNSALIRGTN